MAKPPKRQPPHLLQVRDYLPVLNPPAEMPKPEEVMSTDPMDYFITTGDAVKKTRQYQRELKLWEQEVLTLPPDQSQQFMEELRLTQEGVERMLHDLIEARRGAVHFETIDPDPREGTVKCLPKNPRAVKVFV